MAITLNTEIGDQFANSYVDIAYADDYWGDHWDSIKSDQWAALSDEQKTRLLIKATRVIDAVRFTEPTTSYDDYSSLVYDRVSQTVYFTNLDRERPRKFYYYQALQFPRILDRDPTTGDIFIPEPIMIAQCEQTVYSLNYDETVVANRMQGLNRESVTVGPIKVSQSMNVMGSELSPSAYEYIKPYILKSSNRIARG